MDRYEVLETIGEGAFGTVSRAKHKESGREVRLLSDTHEATCIFDDPRLDFRNSCRRRNPSKNNDSLKH